MASKWESSREGRKTFKNSAENIPPFFITLVFLMLRVAVRLGCLKRNSLVLRKKTQSEHYHMLFRLKAKAAPTFTRNTEHSLGWDVLRPAGPIPYPIRILLQQPLYFFPPFKKVFFRLKQRAGVKRDSGLGQARSQYCQTKPLRCV